MCKQFYYTSLTDDFGSPITSSECNDATDSNDSSVNVQIARDFELVHQWFLSTAELVERWQRMYKDVDCSQHLHDQVKFRDYSSSKEC